MDKLKIPDNWIYCHLEDVCTKPQYGWTTKADKSKGDLRLLRTTDISSGRVDWSNVPFCLKLPKYPSKYYLNNGDIVVSRAGSVGLSFLIKEDIKDAVFASYLVRFKPLITSEYIHYFMHSQMYWNQIQEKSAGIAIPNVNASKLSVLKLPIAPLNEQKRIVDKIERLFSDLDKGEALIKQVQKQLATYRQSVLKAAVTGGWKYEKLDDLGLWSGGGTPRKSEPAYWNNGSIPWVSPKDMKQRYICSSEDLITKEGLNNSSAKLIPAGSVLMVTRSGILAHSFPVAVNKVEVTLNQDLKAITPTKRLLSEFLMICFEAFKQDILHTCSKHGTTVQSIEFDRLKKYQIPVPPLEKQQKIINSIQKIFSQIDAMEKWCEEGLKRSNTLRQSILKDAFSGKLVPQDPADEPASELLKRIKAAQDNKPASTRGRRSKKARMG